MALEDIPLPDNNPNGKAVFDFWQAQAPEMAVTFCSKMSGFAAILGIIFSASSAQNTVTNGNKSWIRDNDALQSVNSKFHSDMNATQWMFRCLTSFTCEIQSLSWVWFSFNSANCLVATNWNSLLDKSKICRECHARRMCWWNGVAQKIESWVMTWHVM